jgi:hypothetical protein
VEKFLASPVEEQAIFGAEARAWIEKWYAPRALLDRHYLPVYRG